MWFLTIACAIMIGMAKTGIQGIGTLVVPLMAIIYGGMPSSGLVLPMLLMADIFGVLYYHRGLHDRAVLRVQQMGLLRGIGGELWLQQRE